MSSKSSPSRRLIARLSALALTAAVALGTTLVASPATAAPLVFAGLGDSYASGVGAGDYIGSDDCYRSSHAYPKQVADAYGEYLYFNACSGAKVQDVIDNQIGNISIAEHITIGVGGNDAGFSRVLGACAGTDTALCLSQVEAANTFIRDELPARLDTLYTKVGERTTYADVAVVGNPRLFNGTTCAGTLAITPEEQEALNGTADLLATTTKGVAADHGYRFVDPRDAFASHAICSADPWLLGWTGSQLESFHPNVAGQNAYTDLLL
ncbi:SGNH/GDSL hydrolase family protein [Stackebrandtia nassauensis]|uniref:Triacylglycerol lipase n=1 Tax=Stackebrandtia nassauensis (strain DSM 44728 / CIP 108903 / NRRL B-16338 / NBRC 102104 / LLR-40K-21) TaxID=446470 RepID=D3PZ28_STANL|nr:SGNH/GDSL hydrolase family protein [Stackebrandtia nassauensis]ADD45457.1 Triacylglycerol lipase [Stackebrandtia nassauensis DSM 44728]